MATISRSAEVNPGALAEPPVLLWKLRSDGSLLTANLATGVAHYSYPSSLNAEAAKTRPREIALSNAASDSDSLALFRSHLAIAPGLAKRNGEWIEELKAAPFHLEAAGRSLTFPSYYAYQVALDWIANHDLDQISEYCEGHGYGLHVPGTQELQPDWVTVAAYVRTICPAPASAIDPDLDIDDIWQPS